MLTLVEQLPIDSATKAAARGGPEHRAWVVDTYLLAQVADLLAGANYQRGGGKGGKPKPVTRPGVKPQTRTMTVAELKALGRSS
ncbi:hypothetical protein [Actinomycetospora sp. CA-053990]|uniref:hypothetical protein n=1 Tax=Actinomycetospora sp. CA-053990 TaxID=3239891 RepID=UPI003D93BACE